MDLSTIRCPICKGDLLTGDDLYCNRCSVRYPIKSGIPIMLNDLMCEDAEQDVALEKDFYENMFSGLTGPDDGHCIVYGYERIYEFIENVQRGTLLEAGCGAGHHSVNLAKMGFTVTSIDLSFKGLMAAKNLVEHQGLENLLLCGDIKRLPFEDNQFDVCFCSLILHHFKRLDNIIKELTRVTEKCFVVFEVNALDPISFFRFNLINPAIGVHNISKNQRALFPGNLERALANNGFGNFKVDYEDVHEYIGKAPESIKAKLIHAYKRSMRIFPEKYSSNKFLLRATR